MLWEGSIAKIAAFEVHIERAQVVDLMMVLLLLVLLLVSVVARCLLQQKPPSQPAFPERQQFDEVVSMFLAERALVVGPDPPVDS